MKLEMGIIGPGVDFTVGHFRSLWKLSPLIAYMPFEIGRPGTPPLNVIVFRVNINDPLDFVEVRKVVITDRSSEENQSSYEDFSGVC